MNQSMGIIIASSSIMHSVFVLDVQNVNFCNILVVIILMNEARKAGGVWVLGGCW